MIDAILPQLPSLGVSGLLFVMWWLERQERARGVNTMREAVNYTNRVLEINDHLLDVIRSNTEALVALREELRSHRATEQEWISRLSRQLEQLEQT
jgi:hypothetical protein